jgi:hypothetical protein
MATLTITDAARVTGVSRMLLYRYIKSGKLSRAPEGLIDTTELLRAGLMLQTSDVTIGVAPLHDVTPVSVTPETSVTAAVTAAVTTETHTLEASLMCCNASSMQLENVRHSCYRCCHRCNNRTSVSSTCPAVPQRLPHAQRGRLRSHILQPLARIPVGPCADASRPCSRRIRKA